MDTTTPEVKGVSHRPCLKYAAVRDGHVLYN